MGQAIKPDRGNRRLFPPLKNPIYLCLTDLRKAIAKHAPDARGVVIDYGAGTQPYRSLFSPECKYMGADFDTKGANEIQISNEGRLPVEDGSADWVVSFQVLEHVRDPELFLGECLRALKPGGTLLLTTHGTWTYHPDPMGACGDYWRWTHEGLRASLEKVGFAQFAYESVCPGWRSLIQQMLVVRDPSRQRKTGLRAGLRRLFAFFMNLFAELSDPLFRRANRKADILPICYLVRATKPAAGQA